MLSRFRGAFTRNVSLTPKGGRRQGMTKEAEQKAILAETYYREGVKGVNQIALDIGVSKMTLYKYLRYRKVEISAYQSKTTKGLV